MQAGVTGSSQRQLFALNRSALGDLESYDRLLKLESAWLGPLMKELEATCPRFGSRAELIEAFDRMLETEKNNPTETSSFLAKRATREQFRVVVQQFALDGLTEAQSFLPIIARLPLPAQMPMMRVFIDEFGCGNYDQTHSRLYIELLTELGLPVDCESYVPITNDETFAFVNIFYWMTLRTPHPEYFVGALAYLENSIPYAFTCFADACSRLGIAHHHYYTEHLHIDGFHAKETRNTLRELDANGKLDCSRAWVGMQMGSLLIGQAFDAAVAKARQEQPS